MIKKHLVAALVTAALGGCKANGTGYLSNRLRDLTDVAHFSTHAISIGATVNAGPIVLGGFAIDGWGGPAEYERLGLGGVTRDWVRGDVIGVGVPLSWADHETTARPNWLQAQSPSDRMHRYTPLFPAWGSFGIELAVILGIGARVDIVELLDFVGGFAGLDLARDDHDPAEEPATGPENTESDSREES